MRTSKFLLATVKETPADAEIISHKLMLRAGVIRKLAAGLYTWLPLGLRVLRKVENIVREEMDRAGAQEMLMPAVQPAELWQESGRWEQYGPELLRFKDRHQRDFCLGPTHEEVVTDLMRREIKSYRQLPANFYQIQTKFRDEIRPRFGVMRAREFLMKDAYSFHIDNASLQETYAQMYRAYSRIFTRLGLQFRAVEADSGAIGGRMSHEFHVLADSGEDAIAICDRCDYAANLEMAAALPPLGKRPAPGAAMTTIDTPNVHSIDDVSRFLKVPPTRMIKTLLVRGTGGAVALVVRGDHELNRLKAQRLAQVAKPLVLVTSGEVEIAAGCEPGSIGPVNLQIPVIADESAARLADFVCGANTSGKHFLNAKWGRDLPEPIVADIRNVVAGDPCPVEKCSGILSVRRGIEVGHVFQLDTKYSEAMHATVLDESGRAIVMPMGCYGIGVSRVVAAAIEQSHDDNGIIWPNAVAPFTVALVPIAYQKSDGVKETIDGLYDQLTAAGIDTLLDDRNERPGVMFADMDLIGIPHRLVVGEKGISKGVVEYKGRRDKQPRDIALDAVVMEIQRALAGP